MTLFFFVMTGLVEILLGSILIFPFVRHFFLDKRAYCRECYDKLKTGAAIQISKKVEREMRLSIRE